MEIYLVRHTKPAIESNIIYGKRLDVSLPKNYIDDCLKVKNKLPDLPFTTFSSPATRCQLLAKELSRDVILDNRLEEIDFGDWEGKTWDSLNQETLNTWMNDFVNIAPPNGESVIDLQKRVHSFWNLLHERNDTHIIVCTHGGFIRTMVCLALELPLAQLYKFDIDYGSITLIKSTKQSNTIKFLNK
jgi:alpha-ribazole phosphatase